jgi:AcrR family transcriptional regulator
MKKVTTPSVKPKTLEGLDSKALVKNTVLRRAPRQERAQHTIETIFEATAQILEVDGVAGISTNRVAAQAGFSIGTLYQYFPSKEAILQAMAVYGRRKIMDALEAYLSEVEAMPNPQQLDPKKVFREFVRIQMEGLATGGIFRRKVIRLCWLVEQPEETAAAIRETSERIQITLQRIQHPLLRSPNPALMFVLSRAMVGAVRSASIEKTPLLGSSELEDELVRLVWGLLAKQP